MTYYANNNQIKEEMLESADVEVNQRSVLVTDPTHSLKDPTLYLFDTPSFFLRLPDTTVQSDFLLVRRPDWGGLDLELMKNEKVYLY